MWGMVEADFQREYGIDLSTPGLLASRTWRWLTVRLAGLSPKAMTRHHMAQETKRANGPADTMAALNRAAGRK